MKIHFSLAKKLCILLENAYFCRLKLRKECNLLEMSVG